MLNEFTVVGEHKEDKAQFLVLGADGHYYEYDPAREQVTAIEPDARWEIIPDTEDSQSEVGLTELK
jgi:hypothetical protein